MVNKTELMALEWLKKKGYKEEDIMKRSHTSPDFICQDGKRYEVKFLYGNRILFYSTQIKNLKGSDIILVFDRAGFVTKFLWEDRKNIAMDLKVIEQKDRTTIQIRNKTLKRLKTLRITERDTYDEILNRLVDKIIGRETKE